MTPADDHRRPYRSALRDEQASRTRRAISDAARTRFVESGWSGTSVRSVAEAAGVSEATVYAVYGSKAGLAVSLIDSADRSADVERVMAELAAAEGDPAGQVRAMAGFDRRLFEHGGDVIRVVVEGARGNVALRDAYLVGRSRGDGVRRELFGAWPSDAWRDGVDVARACDTWALLCSIDTYDVATRERGWTPQQVEDWWVASLVTLLLR